MTETETTNDTAPPDQSENTERSRRRTRVWGAVTLGMVALTLGGVGWILADNGRQDHRIDTLGQVIIDQNRLVGQVCQLAGGQVDVAPEAKHACERVERGEPAVPIPVAVTGAPGEDGTPGVGVSYTRQLDRCYIEVGLTNGAANRLGPFCGGDGLPGPVGPSGSPGPTGEPGQAGAPGVGIADVRPSANPCFVDVVLDDGAVRTVGPFCGPPLGEFTVNRGDGSAEHCIRSGGSDVAPHYQCTVHNPPTTTTATAVEPPATTTVTTTGGPLPARRTG